MEQRQQPQHSARIVHQPALDGRKSDTKLETSKINIARRATIAAASIVKEESSDDQVAADSSFLTAVPEKAHKKKRVRVNEFDGDEQNGGRFRRRCSHGTSPARLTGRNSYVKIDKTVKEFSKEEIRILGSPSVIQQNGKISAMADNMRNPLKQKSAVEKLLQSCGSIKSVNKEPLSRRSKSPDRDSAEASARFQLTVISSNIVP